MALNGVSLIHSVCRRTGLISRPIAEALRLWHDG